MSKLPLRSRDQRTWYEVRRAPPWTDRYVENLETVGGAMFACWRRIGHDSTLELAIWECVGNSSGSHSTLVATAKIGPGGCIQFLEA